MQITWKSIAELPDKGDIAVYDPSICPGCRIINDCFTQGGIIYDSEGDVVADATHFTDTLNEPAPQTS